MSLGEMLRYLGMWMFMSCYMKSPDYFWHSAAWMTGDDMEDKEGPDGDPGEAVKGPGEHPLAPAIGDRSAESATWSREG